MGESGSGRRERLAAYLELHIEQGPVLEAEGCPVAPCSAPSASSVARVVTRARRSRGVHADGPPRRRRRGRGPGDRRRSQAVAREHGGVSTAGRADFAPGIVTAVPGRADVLVDQRHLDPDGLAATLGPRASSAFAEAAAAEGCRLAVESIWSIEPVPFHRGLVDAAAEACAAITGGPGGALPSGALHDASELARVCPATMVFSSSAGGVSHAPDEDTPDADLERALTAYGDLVHRVVAGGAP